MGSVDSPARFDIRRDNTEIRVLVSGCITDFTDLSEVAALSAPHVVLDLANLVRINSRGTILWTKMIESLCQHSKRVDIHNAPHGFIHQYITIHNFMAQAHLESLLATYLCEECGLTKTVTHDRAKDFHDGRVEPKPGPKCSRCHNQMIPDDPVFEFDLEIS
jgi:hypothetical protein